MTSQALKASSAAVRPGRWLHRLGVVQAEQWTAADVRRRLPLVLARLRLLDAVLQCQSFMSTKGFARMLAANSAGNPAVVAEPINWAVRIIDDHGTAVNVVFAVIQLIALSISCRPTVRLGLAGSVAWAAG